MRNHSDEVEPNVRIDYHVDANKDEKCWYIYDRHNINCVKFTSDFLTITTSNH